MRASIRCFSRCPYPGAEPSRSTAGNSHRLHAAKREVIIFDYVDGHEPMFAKMATRREAGYRALGYEVVDAADLFSQRTL